MGASAPSSVARVGQVGKSEAAVGDSAYFSTPVEMHTKFGWKFLLKNLVTIKETACKIIPRDSPRCGLHANPESGIPAKASSIVASPIAEGVISNITHHLTEFLIQISCVETFGC